MYNTSKVQGEQEASLLMLSSKNISLAEFLSIFLFWGILTAVAVAAAQRTSDVLFSTVLNTVRITMVLFAVTMCLFVLPQRSEKRKNFWLLLWTFSFVSFAIHVGYSFFAFFHGSLREFYDSQGIFVATLNLFITAWWTFDVLMAWLSDSTARWVKIQRAGIHYLLWATFFISTVILHAVDNKQLFVIILGILQTVAILICLFIRFRTNSR